MLEDVWGCSSGAPMTSGLHSGSGSWGHCGAWPCSAAASVPSASSSACAMWSGCAEQAIAASQFANLHVAGLTSGVATEHGLQIPGPLYGLGYATGGSIGVQGDASIRSSFWQLQGADDSIAAAAMGTRGCNGCGVSYGDCAAGGSGGGCSGGCGGCGATDVGFGGCGFSVGGLGVGSSETSYAGTESYGGGGNDESAPYLGASLLGVSPGGQRSWGFASEPVTTFVGNWGGWDQASPQSILSFDAAAGQLTGHNQPRVAPPCFSPLLAAIAAPQVTPVPNVEASARDISGQQEIPSQCIGLSFAEMESRLSQSWEECRARSPPVSPPAEPVLRPREVFPVPASLSNGGADERLRGSGGEESSLARTDAPSSYFDEDLSAASFAFLDEDEVIPTTSNSGNAPTSALPLFARALRSSSLFCSTCQARSGPCAFHDPTTGEDSFGAQPRKGLEKPVVGNGGGAIGSRLTVTVRKREEGGGSSACGEESSTEAGGSEVCVVSDGCSDAGEGIQSPLTGGRQHARRHAKVGSGGAAPPPTAAQRAPLARAVLNSTANRNARVAGEDASRIQGGKRHSTGSVAVGGPSRGSRARA